MRVLHHYQLSASARFIRLVLAERDLVFLPKIEIPWERNEAFLSLNPAGDVPVLVAENGLNVILRYGVQRQLMNLTALCFFLLQMLEVTSPARQ